MRRLLAAVAVAAALCTTAPAFADNTKDAHRVVVCSYSYMGQTYTTDMYVLDDVSTAADRASIEGRLQYYELRAVAGERFHEYPFWGDYPQSVQPSDLKGWKCVWREGP